MPTRLLSVLILLISLPVAADEVYLANGRVFEDVEARVEGSRVVIRMTFGEIGLPLEAVERIEKSESGHALFLERRDVLRADPKASAEEWMDLALWARGRKLGHGFREAVLTAARMAPELAGLDALLRELDYVFEPELGRWVSREESLRSRGYELVDGRWLSAEQQLARARLAAEARRAREADSERRLTRAVLALAAAQMAARAEPEPQPRYGPGIVYAWPVGVFPNPFIQRHPVPHKLPPAGHDPTAIPIERRQPGSLFRIEPRGRIGTPQPSPTASGSSSGTGR